MTITISHTRLEGTLLHGSRKGDGVFEIVRDHGFWFSRSLGSLYIRQSRDKEADTWRINGAAAALREAGHEVTVEIDEDTRRTFKEAEADREDRADDRAERFGDRADRASRSSGARLDAAHQIARSIPFGQPIPVGHSGEGRARRDAARIDSNMRAGIAEGDRAGYWADRTRAAENFKAHRNNPQRTARRLEKLRADLRQQERHHPEAAERGWDSDDRHSRYVRDLKEEIAHWEEVVEKAKADGVKLWEPDDFAPGDFVRYLNSWYEVKRVNPKTLSVAWNLRLARTRVMTLEDATFDGGRVGTHSADYTQVQGRCPGEAMRAFLADGKVPGTKSAREASEAAPAGPIREAQAAAKAKKPKQRSAPAGPKRIKLECRPGSRVGTVTWLNGRGQPHKDHPPVTIPGPVDPTCIAPEWSGTLQSQIAELLIEHGYAFRSSWTVFRGGGIVRAIEPTPAAAEQPVL